MSTHVKAIAMALAAVFAATGPAMAAAPEVIYRELFPNDTGLNYGIYDDPRGGLSGWWSNFTSSGVTHHRDYSRPYPTYNDDTSRGELMYYPNANSDCHWGMLSKTKGVVSSLPAVNSNPQLSAPNHGGFYFEDLCLGTIHQYDDTIVAHNSLMWTDEYVLARSQYRIDQFRWYQGNKSLAAADQDRAAVRIGSNWYVSEETFTNAVLVNGNDFWTLAESKTFDFATAHWRTLNFVADSTLTMGSATTLPATGDITAFGLYVDDARDKLRFDLFEVVGTLPEPATLALVGLGGLATLARRRRSAGR